MSFIFLLFLLWKVLLFAISMAKNVDQKPLMTIDRQRLQQPNQQHVAFVFAGSARSFISPFVRISIKNNLLDAFCVRQRLCSYDIFVRVSVNDNKHIGMNAKGVPVLESKEYENKISNALKFFEPIQSSAAKMFIEYFNVSSPVERQEMIDYAKLHPSTEKKHRLYRELDSRRYSMYFNRWKGYSMALRQEQQRGLQYVSVA